MSKTGYLLDTNIVIGLLKSAADVMALVDDLGFDFENAAVSQITRMELLSFPRISEDEEKKIESFLDDCQVIICDEHIERTAIVLRRAHGFKLPDAIIVATAQVNGLELVTLDKQLQGNDK